jgi:hypothetical protein
VVASLWKPTKAYSLKIVLFDYFALNSQSVTFEFDLTLEDICASNILT